MEEVGGSNPLATTILDFSFVRTDPFFLTSLMGRSTSILLLVTLCAEKEENICVWFI